MTFQVKAEVLLNNSNWEKNLKKTSKQMEGFGKSMKTISNGVKAAWAGVAMLGIGAVYDSIVDVTKAAAEDAKTTALLNKVLDKNWKATDKQKQSVSDVIDKMSNLTGIVDDKLKPAYANVARQTHSMTKANKMFALATDIAADKNISVEKASKLVAKAMAGNQKAFDRLYPSASKTGDALKYVGIQAGGMAAAAGQNDPFARINATMDNFKEKLGKAFLPVANNIADWLASPEAQKQLDIIAQKVNDAFAWLTSPEGQAQMKEWMDTFMVLIQNALDLATTVADILSGGAKQKANLSSAMNTRQGKNALNLYGGGQATGKFAYTSAEALNKSTGGNFFAPTLVVNVDPIDGKISRMLKKEAMTRGIPLAKLLK